MKTENIRLELLSVKSLEELREHSAAISALSGRAIEPNIYYDPCLLFPALERFGGDVEFTFLLIYTRPASGKTDDRKLVGFFPLQHADTFRKLPLKHVRLWEHKYCFLTTPLLQPEFVKPSFELAVDWVKSQDELKLIDLHLVSAQELIVDAIKEILAREDFEHDFNFYDRAVLLPQESGDVYIKSVLKRKRRKDFDRQFRQLKKQGKLAWKTLSSLDSPEQFIEQFLTLEASGWKGEEGTALKSKDQDAAFFRDMVRATHETDHLQTLSLTLDENPIAMIVVLTCGDGAYAFKMAYDETYRSNSPGFHLVMELIDRVHEMENIQWMDFCSDPDHSMANRLFCDRKPLFNVTIALQSAVVSKLVQFMPLMKSIKEKLKGNGD